MRYNYWQGGCGVNKARLLFDDWQRAAAAAAAAVQSQPGVTDQRPASHLQPSILAHRSFVRTANDDCITRQAGVVGTSWAVSVCLSVCRHR